MESLLSGLIGALIATVLSIAYQHIFERKKIRNQVLLDIASYCDKVFQYLNYMHVQRDHEYKNKKEAFHKEEYRKISLELNTLLLSSYLSAQIFIAYGEGNIMGLFNKLNSAFIEVSSKLRKATRSAWEIENREIRNMFDSSIDPMKEKLFKNLYSESKLPRIIIGTFARRKK